MKGFISREVRDIKRDCKLELLNVTARPLRCIGEQPYLFVYAFLIRVRFKRSVLGFGNTAVVQVKLKLLQDQKQVYSIFWDFHTSITV